MKGGGFNGLRAIVAMVAGLSSFGPVMASNAEASEQLTPREVGDAGHVARKAGTGTVMRDRRRAKKARNVARNRAAHRGRKS